ncbi:MAG: ATP-binding protein [Streptosporangiaceae bacterium]
MSDTGGVVGRERELATVAAFLDALPSWPAGLLLEGEAGIGKTTVWLAGVTGAAERSCIILSSRPAESEATLSFAALGDLMDGVIGQVLPQLPPPQRRALEVALLIADPVGSPPAQRAVCLAFLGVIRHLSASGPVLIAIDDLQWLDLPSAAALEFALRRLGSEPVGLLASVRIQADGHAASAAGAGLPAGRLTRLQVGPLTVAAFEAALRARVGSRLSRLTVRRIFDASGGNPFYGLELARALNRVGSEPSPGEPLPVPADLRGVLSARLAVLPDGVRDVLLAASCLRSPTTTTLARADGPPALAALQTAALEGVVEIEGTRVRFTHPLLALLEQALQAAREEGDDSSLPLVLAYLADLECWAGNWQTAEHYAAECWEAGERVEHRVWRSMTFYARALMDAQLGRVDAARAGAGEGLSVAAAAGDAWAIILLDGVLGFAELSAGNLQAAEASLSRAADLADRIGLAEPAAWRFHANHVEAVIGLGDLGRAERLLERLAGWGHTSARAWTLATAARCRALLLAASGDTDGAVRALEEAINFHQHLAMPFELGRTLLVMGQVQRRAKRKRAARQHLDRALGIFESLPAPPVGAAGPLGALPHRAPPARPARADRHRGTRRRPGRGRPHQPAGRAGPVPQPPHGGGQPCPGLPQAGGFLAGRARRGHCPQSTRPAPALRAVLAKTFHQQYGVPRALLRNSPGRSRGRSVGGHHGPGRLRAHAAARRPGVRNCRPGTWRRPVAHSCGGRSPSCGNTRFLVTAPNLPSSVTGHQERPHESAVPGHEGEAMRAIARTPRRSRTRTGEQAMMTASPAPAEHIQNRQLEKSVSWTGRERLRCLWYRLRLTVREMNYATRRIVELQAPWIR